MLYVTSVRPGPVSSDPPTYQPEPDPYTYPSSRTYHVPCNWVLPRWNKELKLFDDVTGGKVKVDAAHSQVGTINRRPSTWT